MGPSFNVIKLEYSMVWGDPKSGPFPAKLLCARSDKFVFSKAQSSSLIYCSQLSPSFFKEYPYLQEHSGLSFPVILQFCSHPPLFTEQFAAKQEKINFCTDIQKKH